MNWENKTNAFSCLKNFSHLNGRRKQKVFIGDHPDARAANVLKWERIKRYWLSHRCKRRPLSLIEFQSWEKFDPATQTIKGERAYIFPSTREIESYSRRKTADQQIRDSVNGNLPGEDRNTAWELLSDLVHA